MFKTGIYKFQLNAIVLLLTAIVVFQFVKPIEPAQAAQQPALVKSQVVDNPYGAQHADWSKEYFTISDMRKASKDYQLVCEDNYILMYDDNRLVHVFDFRRNPNCDIFKAVDRDRTHY